MNSELRVYDESIVMSCGGRMAHL